MNALTLNQNNLTMTSREIAELVEKRHENVRRTIETLVENGVIRNPQIEFSENINNLGLARKQSTIPSPANRANAIPSLSSPNSRPSLPPVW